ncbi:septation protein SepH [Luteococcus sp. H138]|uniref:septation protein SepH n=1 Tax=unclassified Luteococcus TaxID=2639923 RepID=UPI00313C4928
MPCSLCPRRAATPRTAPASPDSSTYGSRSTSPGDDMTSALSPRDIQTRIRSGASLEDLVRECGLPMEKVEPFAAPVLAEREHVAGTALQCPVRRRGETGSVRAMRAVVEEKLAAQQVNMDDVTWDAWRNEDRRWSVVGRWQHDGEGHEAQFVFDQRARFSVATNDAARQLIGEVTAAPAPRPVPSAVAADAEPTIDLHDELAVLRAVQGDVPSVSAPKQPSMPPAGTGPRPTPETQPAPETQPVAEQPAPAPEAEPAPARASDIEDEEEVQDYSPAELEEVDGVYDFVPQNTSDMDVLYEMLSSFAEDSVNIYAGLANPVTQEPSADLTEEPAEADDATEGQSEAALADPSLAVLDAAEVEDVAEAEPQVAVEPVIADEPPAEAEHPALAAVREETLAHEETPTAEPVDEPSDQELLDELGDRGTIPAQPQDPSPTAEPVEVPGEVEGEDVEDEDAEPSALIELPAQAPVAVPAAPVVVEVSQPEPGQNTIEVELPSTDPVQETLDEAVESDIAPLAEPVEAAGDAAAEEEPLDKLVGRGSDAPDPTPTAEPVEAPAPEAPAPEVPEQDALVETPQQPTSQPRPKPRPRKKRASIPSWDEIMFGGPTPPKQG